MQIRDRIKELRRVPAKQLLPHPRNWRTHPVSQRQALVAVLTEVGYSDALLARELPDGRLMLIDGHLRAETTPDMAVPVLVVDVTDQEAELLLATLDPLAGLAQRDEEQLRDLIACVQTESAAVEELLATLAATAPAMHEPSDSRTAAEPQYHVLVSCDDEQHQCDMLNRLIGEGLTCRAYVV